MLNKIVAMGRIGKEPELRRTPAGTAVTSFSIACDRDYAQKGAERETDWLDVVCWGSTAEFVCKHFGKGRMAIVSGRLQIRNWTDNNNVKHRNAEIVADNIYFGDSKSQQEPDQTPPVYNQVPDDYEVLDGDDADLPWSDKNF